MAKFREAWDEGHRGASMTLADALNRAGRRRVGQQERAMVHLHRHGRIQRPVREGRSNPVSLGQMMLAIHRVGTHVYPSPPDRLFAHQTGDGFVIQSDFNESSPLRALSIAVVVLRHVASTGRYARAAISEGEIADIVGCYPKEVRDDQVRDGVVSLREGLMTLFSVGMGLIRSVKTNKIGPRGPLLLLAQDFERGYQRTYRHNPLKRTMTRPYQ
jgi:hypothetical protein